MGLAAPLGQLEPHGPRAASRRGLFPGRLDLTLVEVDADELGAVAISRPVRLAPGPVDALGEGPERPGAAALPFAGGFRIAAQGLPGLQAGLLLERLRGQRKRIVRAAAATALLNGEGAEPRIRGAGQLREPALGPRERVVVSVLLAE